MIAGKRAFGSWQKVPTGVFRVVYASLSGHQKTGFPGSISTVLCPTQEVSAGRSLHRSRYEAKEKEHGYAALLDRCFTTFSMTGKEAGEDIITMETGMCPHCDKNKSLLQQERGLIATRMSPISHRNLSDAPTRWMTKL